mgnify:FL=1
MDWNKKTCIGTLVKRSLIGLIAKLNSCERYIDYGVET